MAYVEGEGLVCFDGNHRREALSRMEWGDEFSVFLDVLLNATPRDIFCCFDALNKSVQVPLVFVDDNNVREVVLGAVREFELLYKPFVSTSSRCHAPNFNRDAFVDALYDMYRSLEGKYSLPEIIAALHHLNREYGNGKFGPTRHNIKDKCDKHSFWLFRERRINTDHVLLILQQKTSSSVLMSGTGNKR